MFKKILITLLTISTVAYTSAQPRKSKKITNVKPDKELEKKIDEYFKAYVEGKDFAGNILIARNGKIVANKSYGSANLEYNIANSLSGVFHIASISKPFTAILIMRLIEEGKLNLGDKLEKFIPDFPQGNIITIHHLLSQTSGLPDYNRFPDYNDFSIKSHSLLETVAWFKNKKLSFEPGKEYGYSNANFVTLAYIIEKVTGGTYEDYLAKIITKPFQMKSTANYTFENIVPDRVTGYEIDASPSGLINSPFYDKSFKRGSGAMYSTVTDLLKLDQALYDDKLLTEQSKKNMFTEIDSNGYGYGWIIGKRFDKYRFLEHDGKSPGFASIFSRYPDEKTTIIVLANINSGLFNIIRRDLAAIVFNEPYEISKVRKYIQLSNIEMHRFAGTYAFPSGFKFTIRVEGDYLKCYFGENSIGSLLSPVSTTELFLRSRFDQLTLKVVDGKNVIEYKERTGISICKKIQ